MQTNDILSVMELCEKYGMIFFKYASNGEEIICSKQQYLDIEGEMSKQTPKISAQPLVTQTAVAQAEKDDTSNMVVVRSAYIGIVEFSENILKSIGDLYVEKGEVICNIEAMKLFNEVKAPVAGFVTLLVENGEKVDYDKELFCIKADDYEI